MKKQFPALLLAVAFIPALHAQLPEETTHYAPEVEARIRQVEQSGTFAQKVIAGQPAPTLQERMALYHVNGMSIAVVNNFEVEWVKGYGWADKEEKRPVTPATLFEPGSISKSLNAMGVLRLAQEKRIDLGADINSYLTSWQFPYDKKSGGQKITTAQLLSHTAGLNVHGFPGYLKGDSLPTIVQVLDGKKPANTEAVRSMMKPGKKYEYSGGGVMISELIAMDVSKKPYAEYMQEQVLDPAGMKNSFYTQPPPATYAQRLATGYNLQGTLLPGKYPVLVEQAAGGLWTTAGDLARYITEMQQSLKGNANHVLSQEMTKTMLTPFGDSSSAFGTFINHRGAVAYFSHSAGNQGFSGFYIAGEETGQGVVVLINSDNAPGLISEVVANVQQVYNWPGYERHTPPPVQTIALPDSLRAKYCGFYYDPKFCTVIYDDGSTLQYHASAVDWKMYFTSPVDFINRESVSEKTLLLQADGSVKGLARKINGKESGQAIRRPLVTLSDAELAAFSGKRYIDDKKEVLRFIRQEGRLWMDLNGEMNPVWFVSKNEFVIVEFGGLSFTILLPEKPGGTITIEAVRGKEKIRFHEAAE